MNLSRIKFSDLAHITMGQSPKAETVNESGNGMPLLNGPSEFKNFNPVPVQFTTDAKKLSKESDILFCVRGSTTGRMNWSDQSYALGRGLAALRHKKGSHYNHFLKYLIEINLPSLLKGTSGSTFPNLTSDILSDFELTVPSFEIQSVLSKHLSIIDSKIELNNRINRELEAMAKLIYDYWFVQFDFPMSKAQAESVGKPEMEGKPYKSSGGKMVWNDVLKREIPEGWEVKELSKIVEVINDSIDPSNDPEKEFKYYSIPVWDEKKSFEITKGSEIGSNKYRINDKRILVSKLNPWFSRVIYSSENEDVICSTEFVVWQPKEVKLKSYLFHIATHPHFILYSIQNATGTSNSHKRVNPKVMMKYKVPFNNEAANEFSRVATPIINKIQNNLTQNQELTSLRDWLLPMLMNGQVRVGEAKEYEQKHEDLRMVAEEGGEYGKG